MKIGIIGGGFMDLATAYYLNKKGHEVTILEKEKEIGGLTRSEEIMPGLYWDRFYHVILTTDTELLEFLDELGLSDDIRFRETKTGFYTDGQLHSMSTTMEFLQFKPLSLIDKLRLGAGILYTSKIKNWNRLEKETQDNTQVCSNCLLDNHDDDAEFCKRCGTSLRIIRTPSK